MQEIAKILIIIITIVIIIKVVKVIEYKIRVAKLNHYRYKIAIEALNGAVWEWHEKINVLYISSRIRQVLECDEIIDSMERAKKFIDEKDRENIASLFYDRINNKIKEKFKIEFTVITQGGKKIVFECTGGGRIAKDGTYSLSGTLIDITEEKAKEQLLKASEKNYRLALEGSQDIMFYCDLNKDKLIFNNRIEELLELDHKDTHIISIQQWVNNVVYKDEKKEFMDEFKKVKEGRDEYFSLEYRMKTKGDKVVWVKTRGKIVLEDDRQNIYGSISNINDRKEKELKIFQISRYDEVTGIANRRYFEEKVSELLVNDDTANGDIAIIFIDIDNFKFVNDTYGHQIGDKILILFCNKLKSVLRNVGLLARFGGDEFIISIENIKEKKEIENLLKEIIQTFNNPFDIDGKEIYCTVSIGISILPIENGDFKTALKHADIAMYKAKEDGKNQYYFFNNDMEQKLKRELDIKAGLRKAVKAKEINFKFQPKYWCKEEKIQGVECLARWQNDKLGFIAPNEFIPLAESSGLIVDIGKYLIEDVFETFSKLQSQLGNDFKIAINLSQVQIQDREFIPFIITKIKEYEIQPSLIEFEVTESAIMKYPKNAIKVLEHLKNLGFSIALDDFGTGYSSLNYLKIIPLDVVKIDKSFIDDIGIDTRNEQIIEKIVELAHSLKLSVVAEGVEEAYQVKYLQEIGCDILQGYYFSKPVDIKQLKKEIL